MKVEKIVTKMFQENVYICYDEASGKGAVIDPGGEAGRIIKFLSETGLKIEYILLTHGHFDHIMAVKDVAVHTGAPVAAHSDECELLADSSLNFSREVSGENYGVIPDIKLKDGDVLKIGGGSLRVIATPGHTKGGVCFYDADGTALFSGDTLFYESIGRTDFPGGDFATLEASVRNKLYTLPEDTMVYPGHSRLTTIEHERRNNPYIRP